MWLEFASALQHLFMDVGFTLIGVASI